MTNLAKLIKIDVVDTESQIFSDDAEYLIAPAVEGEIGIYPNHIPLITKLNNGILRIKKANQDEFEVLAISGGFLEVKNNHITILADMVVRTDELDEARLLEEKELALSKIKKGGATIITTDVAKAEAALDIAIAQLKAYEYLKKFKKI